MKPLPDRQRRAARVAVVLLAVVVVVGLVLPVPYVAVKPGPVFNLFAEADGRPVVEVSGAPTFPTEGRLDMVVVLQEGGTAPLSMGSAVAAWLLPTRTVTPKDEVFPEGFEPEQGREIDQALFASSMSTALAAAANHLGRPVSSEAMVRAVEPGAPAEGSLEPGDIVTAVAGRPTATSADVGAAVAAQAPGAEIGVDYVRGGAEGSVVITSGSRDDGAYLGVLLVDNYSSDFEVDIALEGIIGPSAGLIFALAIVDSMTPDALLADVHVGGTGTISADGSVGAIGGVEKKAVSVADAGAGLFLLPEANCADLGDRVPDGLAVAAVDSLDAAIDSITAWRSGDGEFPGCM
jgi:PDZ domain-containing protein